MDEAVETKLAEHIAALDWSGAVTLALRAYGPTILSYHRGVLLDEDAADDVFAHFSERLWRGIKSFRGESSFGTWAYRLAWVAVKQHKRALARRREDRLSSGAMSGLVQQVREQTNLIYRTDVRDQWATIKASLDEDERSLLLLRVDRRLSWKEIEAVMADSGETSGEAALRKRFERLREKLRVLAKKHGLREDR
jgi:RNA polymerase sigma-70 factor (ECF subfamily)